MGSISLNVRGQISKIRREKAVNIGRSCAFECKFIQPSAKSYSTQILVKNCGDHSQAGATPIPRCSPKRPPSKPAMGFTRPDTTSKRGGRDGKVGPAARIPLKSHLRVYLRVPHRRSTFCLATQVGMRYVDRPRRSPGAHGGPNDHKTQGTADCGLHSIQKHGGGEQPHQIQP